jgi:hypothetical protein
VGYIWWASNLPRTHRLNLPRNKLYSFVK